MGLMACIILIISCFMPWTYHADLGKAFSGFYSFQNQYGKPGKLLVLLALLIFAGMILPKVWAKRANLFIAALQAGYAIKTFALFSSCYNTYCPEKKTGLYLMLISSAIILLSAVFPRLSLRNETV